MAADNFFEIRDAERPRERESKYHPTSLLRSSEVSRSLKEELCMEFNILSRPETTRMFVHAPFLVKLDDDGERPKELDLIVWPLKKLVDHEPSLR